jgi:hypothetical protein
MKIPSVGAKLFHAEGRTVGYADSNGSFLQFREST